MDLANVLDFILAGVFIVLLLVAAPVAIGLFLLFYLGRRLYYVVKGEDYVPLFGAGKNRKYEHQDVDAGSSADSIAAVLAKYGKYDTVGKYARDGKADLEAVERKAQALYAILDNKFQEGTISWDKFAVGADSAKQAVVRNCATLANRIQTFDRADYRRLARANRDSSLSSGSKLMPLQQEKLEMLEGCLGDMDAILTSNEQLMFELDKLSAELSKLQDVDFNEDGERILDEIRTLIDETKYYQQA